MSWFKKIFSSESSSSDKKDKAVKITTKNLSPEHREIVEKYIQENPTSLTSMEIIESIAKELEKKPAGVRTILSKAGVYIKHEARTWKNDKELALKRAEVGERYLDPKQLSDELINDREICEALIDYDATQIKDLPDKFKFDREMVIRALRDKENYFLFARQVRY